MTGVPAARSALAAAQAIAAGELRSSALVQRCRDAVHEHDRELHSFVRLDPAAMDRADACDREAARSVLHGVPVAVKDNICTAGLETSCASRMLEGYVPPSDATVVRRLRAAGLVLLGKTNLDELAMGSSTEHSAAGPTRNPWDLRLTPGGSSGGSAAAVAAGLVPLALGSDTGGSVRQPAAFCGVVGLKPTYGCLSRSGLVAFASSLDQIGLLTRTVADATALLGLLAGADEHDATCGCPAGWTAAGSAGPGGIDCRGLRVAVPRQVWSLIESSCEGPLKRALELLRGLGCVINEVELPLLEAAVPAYVVLAAAEASTNLARFDGLRYGQRVEVAGRLADTVRASRGQGFGAEVRRRILLGTFVLAAGFRQAYYDRARAAQRQLARAIGRILATHQVIATPTTPGPAFPLGSRLHDPVAMYRSDVLTVTANLAGLPAVSVPMGLTRPVQGDGSGETRDINGRGALPLGLQLMAGAWQEQTLLGLAAAYEQARGPMPAPVGAVA